MTQNSLIHYITLSNSILTLEPVHHLHPVSEFISPGLPGPPPPVSLQIESAEVDSNIVNQSNEPVIRKSFPESWIFDNFQEYVSKFNRTYLYGRV